MAPSIVQTDVSKAIYDVALPEALKSGSFVSAPPASVVGQGLDKLQQGFDELKKGVSAKKLVVTLP